MKLPRNLSGSDLIRILEKQLGYEFINQEGSHITLQTNEPSKQRITILNHKVLRLGTLNSIIRSISKHKNISREDILYDL
jgi:predicted RNA binding protein YcfA (HicA-like mRNA interferase family)